MPKYDVRLESQTDSQARILTLDADTPDQARQIAEQSEVDLANFTLLPPEKDVWEQPPGTRDDETDGLVDLSRWDAHDKQWADWAAGLSYKDAVKAAKDRLAGYEHCTDITSRGKVRATSLKGRPLARLLAHRQAEPYAVTEVREITQAGLDAQELVRLAKTLRENDPSAWSATLQRLHDAGVPLNAVTAVLYGVPWQKQIDGSSTTVFSSATVKMSLHTGYTLDQDAHDFFNDVSGTEIANGNGYTTGGYTFANKASSYDTASDQVRLDNTVDPNWTSSTISATDAIVWVDTAGASSTDPVYGAIDFGATVTTSNGTFTIALDATGWAVFDLT
jgi:hypothetical protein